MLRPSRSSIRVPHLCFWKWPAVALLAWSCGTVTPLYAQNPDNIDLEEIKRRLTEWRASFVNLRVVWELRSLPKTEDAVVEWSAPPNPQTGKLFCRQEWNWGDHGLDLFENWSFFYEDGTSKSHFIEAFNGPKDTVFRASYRRPPNGAEDFAHLLVQGLRNGKPTSTLERAPMEGLYWPGFAAWLTEILDRWEWKLEEIENIDGEPCARIAAVRTEIADFSEILWLDLSHDCLVRRHRSPAVPEKRKGHDFIVDEFQQLDNGIWFPERGRTQLGSIPHENHLFIVTEVAVNQPLNLGRFDPPKPAVGTIVEDHGRVYKYGVSTMPGGQESQMSTGMPTVADGKTEGAARAFSAVPPTSTWLWQVAALVSVSILFVVVGLWLSHRKQERKL